MSLAARARRDPLFAARALLASRGIASPSKMAIAGALLELGNQKTAEALLKALAGVK